MIPFADKGNAIPRTLARRLPQPVSPMNPLLRIVAVGCCLHLAVAHARAEPDPLAAPDPESLLQAVRTATPSFMSVSYLTKKILSGSGDQWEFEGSLNGTVLEDLYTDISTEALGTPPPGAAESGTPPKPVILRKIHAKREIVEMPVKLQVTKSAGRWTVSRLESEPPLAALGMPSSKYPPNALVFGTSQADAAVRTYNAAVKKLASAEKVAPTPSKPTSEELDKKAKDAADKKAQEAKDAAEKKAQEAKEAADKKAEEAKQARKQSLAKLLQACTSGALYEGTLRERGEMHEVVLDFGRVERNGDFVTADLRAKHASFQRRELSGQIRANPKIPQNFELILMGTDAPTSKTSSKASQAVRYQTSFVLTLDEEANLVGNFESKASYTSQISSITLPSPLSSNAVYQIRFTRSSSHF